MFTVQTPLAQLVLDHPGAAPVLHRHRLDYCGGGELSLAEACARQNLEPGAVLAELTAALASEHPQPEPDPRMLSTGHLVERILRPRHIQVREALPPLVPLAKKVARVHSAHHQNLLDVRDFTEALAEQLEARLKREEDELFPLLTGPGSDARRAAGALLELASDDPGVVATLDRLRTAAHDFQLPESACASYARLYRDLEALEATVSRHLHLERHVLLPRLVS